MSHNWKVRVGNEMVRVVGDYIERDEDNILSIQTEVEGEDEPDEVAWFKDWIYIVREDREPPKDDPVIKNVTHT